MSDDVSVEIRSVLDRRPRQGPRRRSRPAGRRCAEAGLLGLAVPEAARRRGARPGRGRRAAPRARHPRRRPAGLGDALLRPADPGRAAVRRSSRRRSSRQIAAGDAARRSGPQRARSGTADDVPATRSTATGHRPQDRRARSTSCPARPPCCSSPPPTTTVPVVVLVDPHEPTASRCSTTPSSRAERRRGTRYVLDGAPGSACSPTDAADVLREHAIAGLLLHGDGLLAGARDLTAGVHQGAHPVRPLARGVPGASRCRSPTSTSPRGRSTLAADERRLAGRAGEPTSPTTSRSAAYWFCDRGARRRCTPATTCTAAWASTSTYPLHRYFAWVTDIATAARRRRGRPGSVPASRTRRPRTSSSPTSSGRSRTRCASYFSGLVVARRPAAR